MHGNGLSLGSAAEKARKIEMPDDNWLLKMRNALKRIFLGDWKITYATNTTLLLRVFDIERMCPLVPRVLFRKRSKSGGREGDGKRQTERNAAIETLLYQIATVSLSQPLCVGSDRPPVFGLGRSDTERWISACIS